VLGSLASWCSSRSIGSGGKGIVIGQNASKTELDRLRESVRADRAAGCPSHWCSCRWCPRSSANDCGAARRPAPVRGERRPRRLGAARRADPGRAAEGSFVVNSSQGGGSKDTWCSMAPRRSWPRPDLRVSSKSQHRRRCPGRPRIPARPLPKPNNSSNRRPRCLPNRGIADVDRSLCRTRR